MPAEDPAIERLLEWLSRGGARVDRLAITNSASAGRGGIAAVPIASGGLILEIPLRFLITAEIACSSPIGRAIAASGVALRSPHTPIAAYLLEERVNPATFYRPYLDSLPASFPGSPVLFDPYALSFLEGSFTVERIYSRRAVLVSEYADLCKAVSGFDRFSFQDFVWARLVVLSRVFGITVAGAATQALVPLADLLNHKRPRETSWIFHEGWGAFIVTAARDFQPGDAVHDSYGRKCNSRFFVNYGFALADNEDNEAKLDFVDRAGSPRSFQVPIAPEDEAVREMMSFLRSCVAEGDEAARLQASPGLVSAPNEAAALGLLESACDAALGRFPTSIAEDDALLDRPGLPAHLRTAVIVRRGEKRVLAAHRDLAREAAPIVTLPPADLALAVVARTEGRPVDRYLADAAAALLGHDPRRSNPTTRP